MPREPTTTEICFNNIIAWPSTVVGDFDISARFCTPSAATTRSQTVLVMTHGIGADKSYWDPTFAGGEKYSFVQAALAAGYSAFLPLRQTWHREVYEFPIQVEILAALTRILLAHRSPYTLNVSVTSAVHFGYSYGSALTAALASAYPEFTRAISLTGYSGVVDFVNILIAGWQWRAATLLDHAPRGNQHLGLTTVRRSGRSELNLLVISL
ncbi:hypothetical protein FB451DRAFT_1407845 [Mycena latifolia]|nr:hypothetical protein FB451DRAFT_1407845 [Mycena latifolia]